MNSTPKGQGVRLELTKLGPLNTLLLVRFILLSLFLSWLPVYSLAQQRPLITERVETVERGSLRLELGFEFYQEAVYPLSGLEGDLTRLGVLGARFGVGDNVEIQVLGSLQELLNVNRRFVAPNSNQLDFSGNSTSDFGDFTLATKIRLNQEGERLPAFGLRFGMDLPNASNESGLGNDETNAFGTFLVEKSFDRLRLLGNLGVTILGDPIQAGSQDDLFVYGFAAMITAHPNVTLVSEVHGRAGPGGIGTEDQSRVRMGAQIQAGGVSWDLAGFWGIQDADPSTGLLLGISKKFDVF
jgi:hypothetical protein